MGFDTLILKKVSSNSDESSLKQEISVSLLVSFLLSGTVCIVIWIFSHKVATVVFQKPELSKVLAFMVLAIPFQMNVQIISNIYQSLKKTVAAISVLKVITPAVVVGLVMLTGVKDAETLVQIYFWATVGTFTVSVFGIRKYLVVERKLFSRFGDLFNQAKTFWGITVFQQISVWAGQFVVGVYLLAEDAATFAVCRNTTMLMGFLLVAVNFVSAPDFAKYHKEGNFDALRSHFIYTNKLLFLLALPVVVIAVGATEFILGLFGSEYTDTVAKQTLIILVIGQFVNVISGSVGYLLLMTDNEKIYRNGVILNGCIAILACVILIPAYGVRGSALATALSLVFINLYNAYFVNRRLGIPALIFRK
jgi:O-antigen/teichoic acid export membrane protein